MEWLDIGDLIFSEGGTLETPSNGTLEQPPANESKREVNSAPACGESAPSTVPPPINNENNSSAPEETPPLSPPQKRQRSDSFLNSLGDNFDKTEFIPIWDVDDIGASPSPKEASPGEENRAIDDMQNLTEKERKERKQQIRREKNREAVKRCRQRKNARLATLEKQYQQLVQENEGLKTELKQLAVSAPKPHPIEDAFNALPGNHSVGNISEEKDNATSSLSERQALSGSKLKLLEGRLAVLMKMQGRKLSFLHDLEELMHCYHPDAVLIARGQEHRGYNGIKQKLLLNRKAFPDATYEKYEIATHDAEASRVTVRFTLKSTMANQIQYGDVLVPPNEVFQKIKGRTVRVSGYSYLTFVHKDDRILEELQVIKSSYMTETDTSRGTIGGEEDTKVAGATLPSESTLEAVEVIPANDVQ